VQIHAIGKYILEILLLYKKYSSEINSDDKSIYSLIISDKIDAIKYDMNNNNKFIYNNRYINFCLVHQDCLVSGLNLGNIGNV